MKKIEIVIVITFLIAAAALVVTYTMRARGQMNKQIVKPSKTVSNGSREPESVQPDGTVIVGDGTEN